VVVEVASENINGWQLVALVVVVITFTFQMEEQEIHQQPHLPSQGATWRLSRK
jgi:hypothetical protein